MVGAIEPARVRTVMYAAELHAVLLLWPPYLSGVPGEWVELLVRHLKVVAETVFP